MIPGADIIFSDEFSDVEFEKNLIRVKPYGLSIMADFVRPVLLFKDEAKKYTLPVALSQIEAGLTASQSDTQKLQSSPHGFSKSLLESLDIQIEKAVFCKIVNNFQYLKIYLANHPSKKHMIIRADQSMSFLLHLGVSIFASPDFIERSRIMTAEVDMTTRGILRNPSIIKNNKFFIQ